MATTNSGLYEFLTSNTEECVHPAYTQLVIVAAFWKGKILVIHRHSEPFKGKYSIPGGHKEDGETYEQAARRELQEETAIYADRLEPQVIFIDHAHKLECHGFRFDSEDGTFASPPDEEQEVVGWKDLQDAIKLPLTPGLQELFRSFS